MDDELNVGNDLSSGESDDNIGGSNVSGDCTWELPCMDIYGFPETQ